MGQEIFYCWKCKSLIRTRDIEKGKAVRIGDQVSCEECAGELAAPPPAEPARPAVDPLLLSGDSTRSRMQAVVPGKTPRRGTAAAKAGPPVGIYVGAGVLGILVLIVIAAASGGKPPRPASQTDPGETIRIEPAPVPPPRPEPRLDPSPVRPRATERDRVAAARKAVEDVRAFIVANPGHLKGQLERAKAAALEASATEAAADADALLAQVKKAVADHVTAELKALDDRLREPLAKEDFAAALELSEEARARAPFAELAAGAESKAKEIQSAARKALASAVEKILDARRRGAPGVPERPERFGLPEAKAELEKALAQPVEVIPSKEALAYRRRWEEAAALIAPRDYAAAIKALESAPAPAEEAVRAEAAADLEALRLASEVPREAHAAIAKWTRGQAVRLVLNDGPSIEGKFLRHAGAELELLDEEEVVRILLSEIAPSCLSELRSAGAPKAAALFRVLEGDLEGAKLSPVAEKFLAFGRKVAEARADAKEAAARKLFAVAEAESRKPATRGGAAERYRALLAEHASTAFVSRHKALLEARTEAAKDAFYWADDLGGAGTFSRADSARVDSCWTSLAESAPGKAPANFVEFEFFALAEGQTRAWAYAGGCCLETYTFGLQAAELTMPNPKDPKEALACDPGGAHHVPVKNLLSLRKFHVQHGGPKEPARWTWLPLPLPRFAAAGMKKARLVTEQQGFSVAYVFVSTSGRAAPPRDSDLKELEKSRAAHRELLGSGREVPTGSILREYWTGVAGSKIPDLAKHPLFPDKPSGSNLLSNLEIPSEWSDNYGTRIRGYVHPPASGAYTFWISSDDDGELYLSSDESPLRKTRIAWLEGASAPRQFDQQANQKSAAISLVAGRRYYIEVLHKEGAVNDHLCIGWQIPGGPLERPIPGSRLSPWGASGKRSKGTFYRAINLNGPALVIDGHPWEGKGAPNLSFPGKGFEDQSVALSPSVEGAKAQMIRSSVFDAAGSGVTLSAVPAGTYQVYLYVWEDNTAQVYDILLKGKIVTEKYDSGPGGHWERLGPWTVDVADGTIDLRTSGGHANLSGIEVWRLK